MGKAPIKKVQISADALVHLRSTSPLAHGLGIESPHDRLFRTEAGKELAETALSIDPVYEQFTSCATHGALNACGLRLRISRRW